MMRRRGRRNIRENQRSLRQGKEAVLFFKKEPLP
jgi:hypothetical protein